MTASCDAWFYSNQSGIPAVVFGPGSLKHAHSKDEQIAVGEIGAAAEIILSFLERFSGASK
jgi:acetylornithine deacetylase/succinyl-diaminopimelate desuccinylase-like protein